MANGTLYRIEINPTANGSDVYFGSRAVASFNTQGPAKLSLLCEKNGNLVEAIGKLSLQQQSELTSGLQKLKLDAVEYWKDAGGLSNGKLYYSPNDPNGKACKQAGF